MNDVYLSHPIIFAEAVLGLDLYPWQCNVLNAIFERKPTALVAANGSGKTANCIAPLALWFLCRYPKGKLVVTSGVYRQVAEQLWTNLRMYKHRLPTLKFTPVGTNIYTNQGGAAIGFCAVDAGKAEGYHGREEAPLMVIVDEAKTVKDLIFAAFDRCTTQYKLLASSPGEAAGQHYRCFHEELEQWHTVKVTAFDCPHIKPEKIELMRKRYGEESAIFKSMMLAEWGEGDSLLIIRPKELSECIQAAKDGKIKEWSTHESSFHDFAAGGDEDAIATRNGNVIILEQHWRGHDTVQNRMRHVNFCQERGIADYNAFGDGSGIGKIITDDMDFHNNFKMRSFIGGSKAAKKKHADKNADAWFGLAAAIRNQQIVMKYRDEDGKLHIGLPQDAFKQLTTRFIAFAGKEGKYACEPKDKMKERGLHSPDLGDVLAGAWWSQRGTTEEPKERTKEKRDIYRDTSKYGAIL